MGLKIRSYMIDKGSDTFYTTEFRNMLDSYLYWFKVDSTTVVLSVDAHLQDKYVGDFEGLLLELKVPRSLHWLTMRMNDIDDPGVYTLDAASILVPSSSTVDRLLSIHQTTLSKK